FRPPQRPRRPRAGRLQIPWCRDRALVGQRAAAAELPQGDREHRSQARRRPDRRHRGRAQARGAIVMTDDRQGPIEIVGDVARCAICAPPGSPLLTGDSSGIESRVLAWIADEPAKLEQWRRFDRTQAPEDDPYVVIGRALGHSEETARKFGKIADLAFGFQGGVDAYKNFAPPDATATEAEIEAYKRAWREAHP